MLNKVSIYVWLRIKSSNAILFNSSVSYNDKSNNTKLNSSFLDLLELSLPSIRISFCLSTSLYNSVNSFNFFFFFSFFYPAFFGEAF